MRAIEVTRTWTGRVPLGLLLICVAVLALAGCGSGGGGGGPVGADDTGGAANTPVVGTSTGADSGSAGSAAGAGGGSGASSSVVLVPTPPASPAPDPVVILPAQAGVAGSRPGPAPVYPPAAPQDDPAAELEAAQGGGDPSAGGEEVEVAAAEEPEPPGFQVDLAGRRVFLPRWGWLSEQNFWEVYLNIPEDLPEDMDFAALRQLGYPEEGHGGE